MAFLANDMLSIPFYTKVAKLLVPQATGGTKNGVNPRH